MPEETPGQTPGSLQQVDPNEYQRVNDELSRYRFALTKLDPLADEINFLLENPEYAGRVKKFIEHPEYGKAFDDMEAAFETARSRQAPELSPTEKLLVDKMSALEKIANVYTKEREDEATRPQRELQAKRDSWTGDPRNEKFYQKIVHDNPNLKNRDFQYLAYVAEEMNFAPLEDVWKEHSWQFVPQKAQPPPSSLRAGAGDAGIPGPSNNGKSAEGVSMRDRLIELERARRGAA